MAFPQLDEVEGKLRQRSEALHRVFEEAGPDLDLTQVKSVAGTTTDIAAQIKAWNSELTDLGVERDSLLAVQAAAEAAAGRAAKGTPTPVEVPAQRGHEHEDLGSAFLKSAAWSGRAQRVEAVVAPDVEVKTLLTTSSGLPPEVTRSGVMLPMAVRPIQVLDLIPSTTTGQSALSYMEETLLTDAAAEVAEAGTYGEAAMSWTEQTEPVRKIGVWIPVTDEQLADEPRMRGIINNRLPAMIRRRLDSQLLSGAGAAPNLRGILNKSGIQTQARGSDVAPDAIYKAMTAVRVTGRSIPGAVVIHPTNWSTIRLMKTTDGIYIWGSPAEAGPERIWGERVVQADVISAGTALVGDWSTAELSMRQGIEMQVSNSHSDFFTAGKNAIRADLRCGVVWYRPAAFCTVTGLL